MFYYATFLINIFIIMLYFLSLTMEKNRIGDQIKQYRKSKGLTQAELATLCGYESKVRISQIESGYRLPSLGDTLPKICEALGLEFDVVLKPKE